MSAYPTFWHAHHQEQENAIAKTFPEIMITDEEAISQLSPSDDSLTTLRCDVARAKVMRDLHSNPMIGGPRNLPSPPFPTDDSNPPALCTISDSDCSSDSGIDDISTPRKAINSVIRNVKPTTNSADKLYIKFGITDDDANEDPKVSQIETAPPLESPNAPGQHPRKASISFMDNGNPLMTPFLIDLINDDYNMIESDYLVNNELTQVLNDLTNSN